MKKLLLIIANLFLMQFGNAQSDSILYFGQIPPGSDPITFAPGIVSTPGMEHSAPAFTPDGKEIYWSVIRRSNENESRDLVTTRKVALKKWNQRKCSAMLFNDYMKTNIDKKDQPCDNGKLFF